MTQTISRRSLLKISAVGLLSAATAGIHLRVGTPQASAQSTPTTASEAAYYRFKVGEFDCTAIMDGTTVFPVEFYGVNAAEGEVADLMNNFYLPADFVINPSICLLVNTGRNLVLFDTGFGPYAAPGAPVLGGKLMPTLLQLGIEPGDIDTVLLSHAHPDHLGGNLNADGEAAFPNARYVMARQEWDFWVAGEPPQDWQFVTDIARASLQPISDQIELTEGETEVVPGITAFPAFGHTPGHQNYRITSGSDTLLHTVDDAGHYVVALEQPGWFGGFDLDGQQAIETRRRVLDTAAEERLKIMAYHFPFPGLGYVRKNADDTWDWVPTG